MTDVATPQQASASPAAPTPAKKASTAAGKKTKNPRAKPSHPPTSEMVNGAIKSLKERGGSSLQAIKKYVAANYKIDAEKMSPFIKKYLKAAVASGALVQTKGKGASGSFKLASKVTTSDAGVAPKTPARRAAKPKSPKKPAAKAKKTTASSAAEKKPAAAASKTRKPAAERKAPAAAKPKSPSKAKKATKGPTKKPKAPKPKSAKKPAAASSKPSKKAASPKKK